MYRLLPYDNIFANQNILILCPQNDKDKLMLSLKNYIMFLKNLCTGLAENNLHSVSFFPHTVQNLCDFVPKWRMLMSDVGVELTYNILLSIPLWKCKTHLLQRHFLIPLFQRWSQMPLYMYHFFCLLMSFNFYNWYAYCMQRNYTI